MTTMTTTPMTDEEWEEFKATLESMGETLNWRVYDLVVDNDALREENRRLRRLLQAHNFPAN